VLRRLFTRLFDLEPGEEGPVGLLLLMSFFMGSFLATFSVAAQTLFLNNHDALKDLPLAFAVSGAFGLVATDGFFLGIEMILFMRSLPFFQNISGVLLADLFDKIMAFDLHAQDKVSWANELHTPLLITAHGSVTCHNENGKTLTMHQGDVYGPVFPGFDSQNPFTGLTATSRSVVFKINLPDFYQVIANHPEMVEALIENVTSTTNSYNRLNT